MELYGSYTSPYVRHCRLAMLEAGLDFKFVETDALASARKSPTQKVPFLKDGDITLNDSCSIVKYVRERSGKRFLKILKTTTSSAWSIHYWMQLRIFLCWKKMESHQPTALT